MAEIYCHIILLLQHVGMSEMAHVGDTYECPVSSIDCKSTGYE